MAKIALVMSLVVLGGCATAQERLSSAKSTEAVAKSTIELPALPEACMAKMGRAYPKSGEPWVILQKRWEAIADNRDNQTADCVSWYDQYKKSLATPES